MAKGKGQLEIFKEAEALAAASASQGIRPGLERISRLLEIFDKPQNKFKAFHVVGTNGKGSTCAYIAAVLREAGYKTALYTSPHLESPGERLLIDNKQLKAESWLDVINKIAAVIKGDEVLSQDPPSYFEIITAAAFILIAENKVDAAVIEAGLGGRLDATNLLGDVVCDVIASVSMDHMEFLGDTLDKIAAEKFAVIRPDRPACYLGDCPSLIDLFLQTCEERNARAFVVSQEVKLEDVIVDAQGSKFNFKLNKFEISNIKINMLGRYQLSNAALALSALYLALSEFKLITLKHIQDGMNKARWPGRLEVISDKPVIVLDGGHNHDGVIKLASSVSELWGGRKLGIVYAAMRDKDYNSCLKVLSGLDANFYAAAVPDMQRCLPVQDMIKAAKKFKFNNLSKLKNFKTPLDAVKQAVKDGNEVILICGSLYLIGWIRSRLMSQSFRDFSLSNLKNKLEPEPEKIKNIYKDEFCSFETVNIMSCCKLNFAPMGMLFVLMDALRGHEEGFVSITQLAEALNMDRKSILNHLDTLESFGLVRTVSETELNNANKFNRFKFLNDLADVRRGSYRHIELLTRNLIKLDERETGAAGLPYLGRLRNYEALKAAESESSVEIGGKFSQERLKFLINYLSCSGVELSYFSDNSVNDSNLLEAASYLGKYLNFLKNFYLTVKSTLNDCSEFSYSLLKLPAQNVSHIMHLCKLLKESGLFAACEYQKAPRSRIVARVSKMTGAVNFLSGGWLEYYVRDKIISIITTHPATLSMPYAFLKNARGMLPNGSNCEFDFLLCIGEKIFWIEAKTGGYVNFLQRYSRIAKLLNLNRLSSMLVCAEHLDEAKNLTAEYNISCCAVDEFPDVFRLNLVRELQN